MGLNKIKYNRIILKLSGESLMGNDSYGINKDIIINIALQIKEIINLGVEVAIVIGGGNIFRGVNNSATCIDRVTADYMGMLATIMNALALNEAFNFIGISSKVQSSLAVQRLVEEYVRSTSLQYLDQGKVVIFAAGTGNPFFTTDTAAALRGLEMNCDIMLKATNVDGVYDTDPKKNLEAKKFTNITFDEAISKKLKILDATALALCREHKLNIIVFGVYKQGVLKKIILGENEGTLVFSE